jgi:hypothetical protein
MSHILPEAFLVSATGQAIESADAVSFLPSFGSLMQYQIAQLSVHNTDDTVSTIVELLAGDEVKWLMGAPAGGGSSETFAPPLNMGENQIVSVKCRDAAEVDVAVRYRKASTR